MKKNLIDNISTSESSNQIKSFSEKKLNSTKTSAFKTITPPQSQNLFHNSPKKLFISKQVFFTKKNFELTSKNLIIVNNNNDKEENKKEEKKNKNKEKNNTNLSSIKIENQTEKDIDKILINKNLIKKKKTIFITFSLLNKKRQKNAHGANDFDNVQRKIQVNFISFLIDLANDLVSFFLPEEKKFQPVFKDIDYSFKRKVNHNHLQFIKKLSYSDILEKKVSTKFFNFPEDYNKKTLNKVIEKSTYLKNFFSQNYLDMFKIYYFNSLKPLKEIKFLDKVIALSEDTKNFYFFYNNNEKIKELLIKTIYRVYYNEKIEKDNKPFFSTDNKSSNSS